MRPITRPMGVLVALALGATAGAAETLTEEDRSVDEMEAQMMGVESIEMDPMLDRSLVVRAEPDECFAQIGVAGDALPCAGMERQKINQTDLTLGLRSEKFAYVGTTANVLCLATMKFFGPLEPFATDNLVCELGEGQDFRPPRLLRVNADTDAVTDITPDDDPLLASTVGLIGGGAHDGVVLVAGPNLGSEGPEGLNLFAYEGETGRLIGSTTLAEYAYMGTGIVMQDDLYVGVALADPKTGGAILRWTGNSADPFRFERVGELEVTPAHLVEHGDRIAAAGMGRAEPNEAMGPMSGIYLSPIVPEKGLRRADADQWERIFRIDDYEPDPVIAGATIVGELASFRGRLFLTTSQIPLYATMNAFSAYGRPETWFGRLFTHVHSERSAAMLVIDSAGDERQQTTLLYGEAELPAFDPVTGRVEVAMNNLGQEPLYGRSGFGNPFNQAVSDMTVFQDRLYIATRDASTGAPDLFGALEAQERLLDLPADVVSVFDPVVELAFEAHAGADLYRMDTAYSPLVAEDLSGLGNRYNAGVHVLLPFDEQGKLYAGTSNPFNLRIGEAPGGFELISLTPLAE